MFHFFNHLRTNNVSVIAVSTNELFQPINEKCYPYNEASQLIRSANHLIGFCMTGTLGINDLKTIFVLKSELLSLSCFVLEENFKGH